MIPITTFGGRTVAVFGLGGSGIVSAQALIAGGASVIAFDDNEDSLAKAKAAGIHVADLRKTDWSKVAALVLAPGVPLTHPQPHWTVQAAHNAGVEVIGDIELFCRERRHISLGSPFVAITGTNGKSTTTALIAHLAASAGLDAQLGGNIGTAILSLAPPREGRVHVIECSSYQIDLAPTLDPSVGILINLSEDHLDRHGTMEHYAAVKERLVAGVPDNGEIVIGVDDNWCRTIADRLEQSGKPVTRVSVQHALPDGIYVVDRQIMRATGARSTLIARTRRHRFAARPAQRTERRLCYGGGVGARPFCRCGASGFAFLPRSCAPHGGGGNPRRRALCQRLQGDQRRFHCAGVSLLRRHFLDCRRQTEDRRHPVAA